MSPRAGKRAGVLEFAVLGLLHETPMHGYELRKRLGAVLGPFHAISYGSLYPCLKDLVARGLIVEDAAASTGLGTSALTGRRARIAYQLTADGKEHFAELLGAVGPEAWEDERFGVHFAFFARTTGEVRLRILEGRRSRLEERVATLRGALGRTRDRLDGYTLELQQHGLESVEREVRWLGDLIEHEQRLSADQDRADQDRARRAGLTHDRPVRPVGDDSSTYEHTISGAAPPQPVVPTTGSGHRPSARGR